MKRTKLKGKTVGQIENHERERRMEKARKKRAAVDAIDGKDEETRTKIKRAQLKQEPRYRVELGNVHGPQKIRVRKLMPDGKVESERVSNWLTPEELYEFTTSDPPEKVGKDPLKPLAGTLAKLGSIIVHAEEAASPKGHPYDLTVLRQLFADPDVTDWLNGMRKLALLPVRR